MGTSDAYTEYLPLLSNYLLPPPLNYFLNQRTASLASRFDLRFESCRRYLDQKYGLRRAPASGRRRVQVTMLSPNH